MRRLCLLLVVSAGVVGMGCSPTKIGVNRMADTITATADAYTRDDDPEFVRLAAPGTLKMVEMLLDDVPTHQGLLLSACSGFAQYAFAFPQSDAERLEIANPSAAHELRAQAGRMYARARGYCERALDVAHPGMSRALASDPRTAVSRATKGDVPALYWTAVSLGGTAATADDPLAAIKEITAVRALLDRALALDEGWESGALHEAMIAIEALPALLGGSPSRAREQFARAVALSDGAAAFPYVALAMGVAQPAHDRGEFERLLKLALAVDVDRRPSLRLQNLVAQRRARFLLSEVDRLFKSHAG